MRMVESFHEPNLPPNAFLPLDVFDPLLLINLESNFFVQFLVHSDPNHCISALADLLAYDVVGERMLVREHYLFLGLLGNLSGGSLFSSPNLKVVLWRGCALWTIL